MIILHCQYTSYIKRFAPHGVPSDYPGDKTTVWAGGHQTSDSELTFSFQTTGNRRPTSSRANVQVINSSSHYIISSISSSCYECYISKVNDIICNNPSISYTSSLAAEL